MILTMRRGLFRNFDTGGELVEGLGYRDFTLSFPTQNIDFMNLPPVSILMQLMAPAVSDDCETIAWPQENPINTDWLARLQRMQAHVAHRKEK